MKTFSRISAVLVNWNRDRLLQKAIDSLRVQEYPNLEIIVVDNGSTDGSLDWLRREPHLILIENSRNRGASAARNQGTRAATGDYILYMDSDAELRTEGGLTRLAAGLDEDPECAGIAGIYYSDKPLTRLWCWSPCMDWEGNHDLAGSLRPKDDPPVLSTCFALFRHAALREVGGFDEFFFYLYEDADLCERLRKKSYRLRVDPTIKILHHYAEPGRTKRGQIDYHYYHERLRMYFLLKNWGIRRFLASWWAKVRSPKQFFQQFPYMPLRYFIDIYFLRVFLYMLQYPYIRVRRKWRWL